MALGSAIPVGADYEWCDIDPPVAVTTPSGATVVVYVTLGAYGVHNAPINELSHISTTTQRSPRGGTDVTMTILADDWVLGGYETRAYVSSLPQELGQYYASGTGSSGTPMVLQFHLTTN